MRKNVILIMCLLFFFQWGMSQCGSNYNPNLPTDYRSDKILTGSSDDIASSGARYAILNGNPQTVEFFVDPSKNAQVLRTNMQDFAGYPDAGDTTFAGDLDKPGQRVLIADFDTSDRDYEMLVVADTTNDNGVIVNYYSTFAQTGQLTNTWNGWTQQTHILPGVDIDSLIVRKGNFDSDGQLDIVLIYEDNTDIHIDVVHNNGGQWNTITAATLDHDIFPIGLLDTVLVGNIDNDTNHDLAFVAYNALNGNMTQMVNFISNGDGTFLLPDFSNPVSNSGVNLTAGNSRIFLKDIDGDNLDDLIFVDNYSGTTLQIRARLNGCSWSPHYLDTGQPYTDNVDQIKFGDANGDGRHDLMLVHDRGDGAGIRLATYYFNPGNGQWTAHTKNITGAADNIPGQWYLIQGDSPTDILTDNTDDFVLVSKMVAYGSNRYFDWRAYQPIVP